MSEDFFAPDQGDIVLITASIPNYMRSNARIAAYGTMLCAMAMTLHLTRKSEQFVRFCVAQSFSILESRCIIVYEYNHTDDIVVPNSTALPVPKPTSGVNLDELLKEKGNGKTDPPPTPPS